jgi:hypothetical protein
LAFRRDLTITLQHRLHPLPELSLKYGGHLLQERLVSLDLSPGGFKLRQPGVALILIALILVIAVRGGHSGGG